MSTSVPSSSSLAGLVPPESGLGSSPNSGSKSSKSNVTGLTGRSATNAGDKDIGDKVRALVAKEIQSSQSSIVKDLLAAITSLPAFASSSSTGVSSSGIQQQLLGNTPSQSSSSSSLSSGSGPGSGRSTSLLAGLREHLNEDAGHTPRPKSRSKPSSTTVTSNKPLTSLLVSHGAARVPGHGDSDDENDSGDDDDNDVDDADVHGADDGHSGKVRSVAAVNISDRIAPVILSQIKVYGSLVNWVRITDWKNTRNKNECNALAMAIDLLLEENEISEDSLALEMLIRRLNGVHMADTSGNWGVCNALQWTGPNNTLLPRSTLTQALKQAAQMEKLTKRSAGDAAYGGGGGTGRSYGSGGRGGGRRSFGGRGQYGKQFGNNNNDNNGKGTSGHAGGAAHK